MSNNRQKTNTSGQTIPIQILDDLSTRFVINIPKEERNDLIRVCFQLELAHWHYLDFICQTEPLLPRYNFTKFCVIIFRHIPFLNKYLPELDSIIAKWKEYKIAVPTCGAILLDSALENVLLVQGYGSKSWGFPKGKINENEPHINCAVREVKEETGYDCTDQISEHSYLERHVSESSIRLYIIKDVDKEFLFKPIARNEIKEIKWFDVSELPVRTYDINGSVVGNANQFYTVCSFVRPLRKWISREHQIDRQRLRETDPNGNQSNERFWAKSWDNIKFDWDSIWRDIHKEL